MLKPATLGLINTIDGSVAYTIGLDSGGSVFDLTAAIFFDKAS